jgi:hypothetical protein
MMLGINVYIVWPKINVFVYFSVAIVSKAMIYMSSTSLMTRRKQEVY